MRPATIHSPGPGQESVWDYPRPPRSERTQRHIEVVFAGQLIADTRAAVRVLETSHPPTYYVPQKDVRMEFLTVCPRSSWCEFKGRAQYLTVTVDSHVAEAAAWLYPEPSPGFESLAGHIAFYCAAMERCLVDGEVALAQPGGFYGGWITSHVVGPFKGESGSWGW